MDKNHSNRSRYSKGPLRFGEFAGLNLTGKPGFGEDAEHCEECEHTRRKGTNLIVFGIVVAMLSAVAPYGQNVDLYVLPGSLISPLIVGFGLGVISFIFGIYRFSTTGPMRGQSPIPFPVVPEHVDCKFTEHASGTISLDSDSTYHSNLDEPIGHVSLTFFCDPAQESRRYTAFQKGRKRSSSESGSAHFGFVQLKGEIEIELESDLATLKDRVNTLRIREDPLDLQFLHDDDTGAKESFFTYRENYRIHNAERGQSIAQIPIVLLPLISGSQPHRTIEIVVLVSTSETWRELGQLDWIEQFSVNLPDRLGRVMETDPPAQVGPGQEVSENAITWKRVRGQGRDRIVFGVNFDRELKGLSTTALSGSLRLRFAGTMSGISGVNLFSSLGKGLPQEIVEVKRESYIDVQFELSLASLLMTKDHHEKGSVVESGILPDFATIRCIIDSLNRNEVLVTRVIERAPQTGQGGSRILYRNWELSGSYFEGLWPIYFNLTVTGQHSTADTLSGPVAQTSIEIGVRSTYHRDEMRSSVEAFFENLKNLVHEGVKSAPRRSGDTTSTPMGEHQNFEQGEIVNTNVPIRAKSMLSPSGSTSRETSLAQAISPGSAEKAPRMSSEEKRDRLEEALLNGKISEKTYRQILGRLDS